MDYSSYYQAAREALDWTAEVSSDKRRLKWLVCRTRSKTTPSASCTARRPFLEAFDYVFNLGFLGARTAATQTGCPG